MSDTPRTEEAINADAPNRQARWLRVCHCARQLERELNEAMKWKEADPRMYQEQVRVSDAAYQNLHERHKDLQQQLDDCIKDRGEDNAKHLGAISELRHKIAIATSALVAAPCSCGGLLDGGKLCQRCNTLKILNP